MGRRVVQAQRGCGWGRQDMPLSLSSLQSEIENTLNLKQPLLLRWDSFFQGDLAKCRIVNAVLFLSQ